MDQENILPVSSSETSTIPMLQHPVSFSSISSPMPPSPSWIPQQFEPSSEEGTSVLHPPSIPSSLYSQSVSILQSPPTLSNSWTRFPQNSQAALLSPPNLSHIAPLPVPFTDDSMQQIHSEMGQLTNLQPVTPSRLNSSPRQICGLTNQPMATPSRAQSSASGFRSPPTPFRLIGPDGTELQPIITKKGNGKISITYPLNMLANAAYKQIAPYPGPLPIVTNPQPSTACFSMFLSHPGIFMKPTPNNIKDGTQTLQSDSGARMESSGEPSSQQLSAAAETSTKDLGTGVSVSEKNEKDEDDADEEEERQNVSNITKALNIECDVYKEKKKRRGRNDAHSRLPKDVQGLMGEANLCYARGEYDNAVKMCMEIIRIAPWCPDPFDTLAMVYEERGENIKALQYSLLAAHLQTGDVDLWLSLADRCEEAGFLTQAAHCYNKTMKLKPDDYKLHWAAAVLQQQLGNIFQALTLFKSVVRLIPESEVNQRMALARDIARACHANNETALALEVMDEVASKHPDDVKYEDVNVMCELAITSKQYRKVFDMLVKHCQIEVQYESEEGVEGVFMPTHVEIPQELPVDLKCKCVLAAIPLGCFGIVNPVFEEICNLDSSEYGDLQFDIAELLMEEKHYEKAVYTLNILVQSKDYALAAVWLKKGECHRELEQHIEEMECFREVIKGAPGHAKAYFLLCEVLRKLGKFMEAKEVIQDAETYELEGEEQMLLNYETFKVYYEWSSVSKKRHEKLCKAGDLALLMLANKLEAVFVPAKTILVRKARGSGRHKGDIRVSRRVANNYFKYREKKSLAAKGSSTVLSSEEWWDFFLKTCNILLETERYLDTITIVDAALFYSHWYLKMPRRLKLERMACSVCIMSGNYSLAYTFMRPWLLQKPSGNVLWNLFNQVTARSQDQRHHRFCLRSLVKEPDSIALAVLTGHNSLATGTYKHSLGEYIRAHKQIPSEPMFMLLIGVIYIHMSSQRYTTHKNSLVIQALAFLYKYMQHRKCDQESYYNLARAYHQLGLRHFALHWYKKALETPTPKADIAESKVDLKHEIAYNLAILYRKSGNLPLATKVLQEYCVV